MHIYIDTVQKGKGGYRQGAPFKTLAYSALLRPPLNKHQTGKTRYLFRFEALKESETVYLGGP